MTAVAAQEVRSVALIGFGLDSLIEIGASTVVIWELRGTGESRQRLGLRLIGGAFAALGLYLGVQSTFALITADREDPSTLGIAWTALTALVMLLLAAGKTRTGNALGNPVLSAEGRVNAHRRAARARGPRRSLTQLGTWLVVGRPDEAAVGRIFREESGPSVAA